MLVWLESRRRNDGLAVIVTHELEPFIDTVDHLIAASDGTFRSLGPLPEDREERRRLLESSAGGS